MDLEAEVKAYAEAGFDEVNQRFVGRLLELTGDRAKCDCIDLGCGPGDIAMRVARARPHWHITAVDASRPMLQCASDAAARSGLSSQIVWQEADAKLLPFDAGSFDVIYSNSLLHHITDATAVWREIKRIAQPGATIFLRDLYRPADEAAARAIVESHARGESDLLREEFYRSLLSAYSAEEIGAQLGAVPLEGLQVEIVNDRHIDVFGRADIYARRS